MELLRWLTLVGWLSLAATHLTTVCTSTAPSQCGSSSLTFWFGTYHNLALGASAPGSVHITTPTGDTITGAFTDLCSRQRPSAARARARTSRRTAHRA